MIRDYPTTTSPKVQTLQMRAVAERKEKLRARLGLLRHVEKVAVVLLLLMVSRIALPPFLPELPATAYRLASIGLGLLIVWRYIPQMLGMLVSNIPLTLLLIFAGMGIFWSFAPDNSLEPVLLLYMTGFFGIYIAMRFSLEEQLSLMVWFSVVTLVISLIMVYFYPDQGGLHTTGPHEGVWRGGFSHKNQYGTLLALSALPLIMLWMKWGRWRFVAGIPLLWAILNSDSATALASTVGIIALLPLMRVLKLRHKILTGVLLALLPFVLMVSMLLMFNSDSVLQALGRSTTLTGRTTLWDASMDLIAQRPLGGWGLRGSFSPDSPIHDQITWGAQFAHNHWIDTMLETGIIGLILYVMALAIAVWQGVMYASRKGTLVALFPIVFLIQLHMILFATQSVLTMFDMAWIMFVAIVYGLAIADKPLGNLPYRRKYDAT